MLRCIAQSWCKRWGENALIVLPRFNLNSIAAPDVGMSTTGCRGRKGFAGIGKNFWPEICSCSVGNVTIEKLQPRIPRPASKLPAHQTLAAQRHVELVEWDLVGEGRGCAGETCFGFLFPQKLFG